MRSRYRANRIGNCGTAADACRDGCRRPALGRPGNWVSESRRTKCEALHLFSSPAPLTAHKATDCPVSISWNVLTYARMQTEDPIIPRRSFLASQNTGWWLPIFDRYKASQAVNARDGLPSAGRGQPSRHASAAVPQLPIRLAR